MFVVGIESGSIYIYIDIICVCICVCVYVHALCCAFSNPLNMCQQGRPDAYFHINEVINFFIVLMAMPLGVRIQWAGPYGTSFLRNAALVHQPIRFSPAMP